MGWGKRISSMMVAVVLVGIVAACGQTDSLQAAPSATTAETNGAAD